MSWWTSQQIHPKTKSKFVVVFGGMFYLPNIKSLNKPKVDFDTKEFRLLNHKFNYPGNGTWQPITMKFVDMNGMGRKQDHFDTGAFLWQIMNNTGYTYPYVDNSQLEILIFVMLQHQEIISEVNSAVVIMFQQNLNLMAQAKVGKQ